MTVTIEEFRNYVGAADVNEVILADCLDVANLACQNYIGSQADNVPDPVFDMAVLHAGSELYHHKNAPNGISQFAAFDGAPVRVARDFMVAARPILAPYLIVGF